VINLDSKELETWGKDFCSSASKADNGMDNLKKWYDQIFDKNFDYIVFLDNKTYNLALIMERITKKSMLKEKLYTSSSFLTNIDDCVKYYKKNGCLPKFCVFTNVSIHSRGLNLFFEYLKQELKRRNISDDVGELWNLVCDTSQICQFVTSQGIYNALALRLTLHQFNIYESESINTCRQFSCGFSKWIHKSLLNSNSYTYSIKLSKEQVSNIVKNKEWIKTSYQNNTEYANISIETSGEKAYAISSIRIIESSIAGDVEYQVIPEIFLSNLETGETKRIWNEILEHLTSNKTYQKIVNNWSDIHGLRAFNEWINLVLNNILLNDFLKENNIEKTSLDEEELNRIAINFKLSNNKSSIDFLKWSLSCKDFDKNKMVDMLLRNISEERYLFKVNEKQDEYKKRDLLELENYFYKIAFNKEVFIKKVPMQFLPSEGHRMVRDDTYVQGFARGILEGKSTEAIKKTFAYFLQMVDSGMLEITPETPLTVKAVGYCQFIRVHNQTLILYPLRYSDYYVMLRDIGKYCEQHSKYLLDVSKDYLNSSICNFDKSTKEGLFNYVNALKMLNEFPSDFCPYYYMNQHGDDENTDTFDEAVKYTKIRRSYVANWHEYIDYLNNPQKRSLIKK
jgi:hypothetical protein